jgi:hypothetical protein
MNIYQMTPPLTYFTNDQIQKILLRLSQQPVLFKNSPNLLSKDIDRLISDACQCVIDVNEIDQKNKIDILKKEIKKIHRKYRALLCYIEKQQKLYVALSFPFDLTKTDCNASLHMLSNEDISSQMQVIIYRKSTKSQISSNQRFTKCIILDQFNLNLILKIDPLLHKKIGDALDDGDAF